MTNGTELDATRAASLIAAVTFLAMLGIGLVLPVLPEIARHYDLTSPDVTLLMAWCALWVRETQIALAGP